jgi:hypothetical protein
MATGQQSHPPTKRIHFVRRFDSVDCSDVVLIERGQHARFPLESSETIGIGHQAGKTFIATSRPNLVFDTPQPCRLCRGER